MKPSLKKKLRKFNIVTHRDVGYFFSTLIIIYCLSGFALNHVDDWNPDFIITKTDVEIPSSFPFENPSPSHINSLSTIVGESNYRVYDKPTPDQVKVYYKNATLHIHKKSLSGTYEQVKRRPIFYEANVLHRNSLAGWKWVSDIFAFFLIVISITGLFVLKGKKGFRKRGVWFMLAGALLPVIAWLIFGLK